MSVLWAEIGVAIAAFCSHSAYATHYIELQAMACSVEPSLLQQTTGLINADCDLSGNCRKKNA